MGLCLLACCLLVGCKNPQKAKEKTMKVRGQVRSAPANRARRPLIRFRVLPRPAPVVKPATIRLTAVGDIMVHGHQLKSAYRASCKCYKWDTPFSTIAPLFRKSDIVLGNLETTFPGPKGGYGGFPNFGVPDSLAVSLKKAGFSLLTNANNHIYDKETAGLVRTVNTLKRVGLGHAGAYRSVREARTAPHFQMLTRKGIKVAVLSFTSHINHPRNAYRRLRFDNQKAYPRVRVDFVDTDAIKKHVGLARKAGADVVVVYHHFGEEYKHVPSVRQKRVVTATIQAGADVVLGAHPHVVQPVRAFVAKDALGRSGPRVVAYSLGNLISNMRKGYTAGGIAVHVTITRSITKKGKPVVRVTGADVSHLWVYRKRNPKRKWRTFYILPVNDYLSNQRTPKLGKWDLAAMKRFHRHTTALLKRGRASFRAIFK
jgi:poly-gamma-glutamate synthesis protein (capsule biosynthesis protein)